MAEAAASDGDDNTTPSAVIELSQDNLTVAVADASSATNNEQLTQKNGGIGDYFALMKPNVIVLLQITALCAVLAHDLIEWRAGRGFDALTTIRTSVVVFVGGMLTAGGANAINMWYDRDIDPLMRRTALRPIPAGAVSENAALLFGVTISVIGVAWFAVLSNSVAAFWAGFSILFYVFIYTIWLKRSSTQNIVIGGAAGATPPLIGWAATLPPSAVSLANPLALGSPLPWLLFLLIFLWTPPHFWALALYKSDEYAKAGVPMLPSVKGAERTLIEMKVYSLLLIGLATMPWLNPSEVGGVIAILWTAVALLLGVWYNLSVMRIDAREALDSKGRLPSAFASFFRSMLYLAYMFIGLVLVLAPFLFSSGVLLLVLFLWTRKRLVKAQARIGLYQ